MAFRDPYILQPSEQFNVTGRQEAGQDLSLVAAPDFGAVGGSVRDGLGNPIADATVKLFDGVDPFEHVDTNADGQFLFGEIPAGNYTITVSKNGFLTPQAIPVTVAANGASTADLTMQTDPNAQTISVYGKILDALGNPIAGATVELYSENGHVASVTANDDGQYVFTELESGTYVVSAVKMGYFSAEGLLGEITEPGYIKEDLVLEVDPNFDNGTISGLVSDNETGTPVNNAIVALYSVANGEETMVRITRTNADGLYLFGNIGTGDYIVKATVQETI